ncbi:hypothetical protein MPDQ_001581, partial [Monascus purpureus]
GRTVGGASGISLSTARVLASRGATLALCDINDHNLQTAAKLCTESGAKAVPTRVVDIRNPKEVDDWIADILKTYGRLDGAANIAGVSQRPGTTGLVDLKDTSDEFWEFVLGVNATGT